MSTQSEIEEEITLHISEEGIYRALITLHIEEPPIRPSEKENTPITLHGGGCCRL